MVANYPDIYVQMRLLYGEHTAYVSGSYSAPTSSVSLLLVCIHGLAMGLQFTTL